MSSKSESSNSSNSSISSKNNNKKQNKYLCIKNISNYSKITTNLLLDNKGFSPKLLKINLDIESPKLKALMDNIEALDKSDMKKHGKLFKHIIYTNNSSSSYGIKIIASTFAAYNYNLAIEPQVGNKFKVKDDEILKETENNNFTLLISKSLFGKTMNSKTVKDIMLKFNSRPDNTNGNLIRFLLLDQGYKEGIDVFDVKYIHLFEPLVNSSDEKQAIGRGTRFCGQKGLEFNPHFGWQLYVFRYEINIPETLLKENSKLLDAKNMTELFIKYDNSISLDKLIFSSELEKISIESAIDYNLNLKLHGYIHQGKAKSSSGGSNSPPYETALVLYDDNITRYPRNILNYSDMKKFINKKFSELSHKDIVIENLCEEKKGGNPYTLVSYTNTQELIRNYFTPESAYKGMLLYHSVGSGKTCTGIATASSSFEKQGYTILWVTRHTLKSDIWKNMYSQVCSVDIKERLESGKLKLPKKMTGPMKYVSKSWIEPISYKQFSNMLLKGNRFYSQMVARNGEEDPLRKTLIIIDEAHKIYSPETAAAEKPNTVILEEMINNSYKVSKENSVKLLLMTATPYTSEAIEMIKLLNLIREDKLPDNYEEFKGKFLNDNGEIKNKDTFKDLLSGYISYLNKSKDIRFFSYPMIKDINVKISEEYENEFTKKAYKLSVKEKKKELKEIQRENKKGNKVNIKECENKVKGKNKEEINKTKIEEKEANEKCKEKPLKQRKECKEEVKDFYDKLKEELKEEYENEIKKCKELNITLSEEKQKLFDELLHFFEIHEKYTLESKENKQKIQNVSLKISKIRESINGLKGLFDAKRSTMAEKKEYKIKLEKLKNEIKTELGNKKKLMANQIFLNAEVNIQEKKINQTDRLIKKCLGHVYNEYRRKSSSPIKKESPLKESPLKESIEVKPDKFYCVKPFKNLKYLTLTDAEKKQGIRDRINSCEKGEKPHERFKDREYSQKQQCIEECRL